MREMLAGTPVVPVMVIKRLEDAVPLARALVDGGLNILEVTLRTEVALAAIAEIVREVPQAIVGSGTVCNAQQMAQSVDAGCQFMVSPGTTEKLLDDAKKSPIPLLPGISSVGELMRCQEYGYRDMKFFPAEASGGAAAIKAISGPFGDIKFCPTGGIGMGNVMSYLQMPNIMCVGGSWICPDNLIEQKNWTEIERLTAQAAALR